MKIECVELSSMTIDDVLYTQSNDNIIISTDRNQRAIQ